MAVPGYYTPMSPTQAVNTWADNFWGPVNSVNGFFSQTSATPPAPGPALMPYGISVSAVGSFADAAFLQQGAAGSAMSMAMQTFTKTAIAQNTATTLCTFTVPNVAASAAGIIFMRTGITQASHIYDSTMASITNFAITRKAGGVATRAIGLVTDAGAPTEATVGSGYTLTSVLSFAAESGGATATNTIALQVTNVGSTSSTSETEVCILWFNGAAGGVTVA